MSSDVLSIISLVVSASTLAINFIIYCKSKFNIKILQVNNECLYIDPIDTRGGSTHSIVLHLRILNQSSTPVTISSFEMKVNNFKLEAVRKFLGSCKPELRDGEGSYILNVSDEYINQPMELKPYGEVVGYVVFERAGQINKDFDRLKFKMVTSRGDKTFRCDVITQEFVKSWFT